MLGSANVTSLPVATWVYLTFYITTLFVHFVFMAYVLGGSIYLLVSKLGPGSKLNISTIKADPVIGLLRDWMPFAISAAITAGVAPLLFIQILYKHSFYTANLLLLHRWMAIVPVLIAAFYLAYVVKSGRFDRMARRWRIALLTLVAACFLFVAWSWTENHLLSLDRDKWLSFYEANRWLYFSKKLLPRLLTWIALTFAIMPQLVRWQLWVTNAVGAGDEARLIRRRLNWISFGGLAVSSLFLAATGIPYVDVSHLPNTLQLAKSIGLFGGGASLLIALLMLAIVPPRPTTAAYLRPRLVLIIALALYLLAILCLRELQRLATVDLAKLIPKHEAAAESGGLLVFIAFTIINITLAYVCIRIAKKAIASPPSDKESEQDTKPPTA